MSSWRDQGFAVVDVEATGLDPRTSEVISIGIVHIDQGAIPAASAFYSLVRPARMPDPDDIVIHGIRPRDLADSPTPDEVLPHVVGALADRDVVAHVAHIEESLLAPWLARGGFQLPRELIDTDVLTQLYLAQTRRLTLPGHVGLGAAASLFGLPEHQRHHALGDALTTAQLFLALATLLTPGGVSMHQVAGARRALNRQRCRLSWQRLRHRLTGTTANPNPMEES